MKERRGGLSPDSDAGVGRGREEDLGLRERDPRRTESDVDNGERKITDSLQPGIEVTGAPDDSAVVALTYEPSQLLSITPSLERWSDVTGGDYVRMRLNF